jgi:hypothetical protein
MLSRVDSYRLFLYQTGLGTFSVLTIDAGVL